MEAEFLFAQPSPIYGWASLIDLFGVFTSYNTSRTRKIADTRATYADWCAVANDLRDAMETNCFMVPLLLSASRVPSRRSR